MSAQPDDVGRINREIVELWTARFSGNNPPVPWPLICPEPSRNGLTVVGCNPSLPKINYHTVPTFNTERVTDEQIVELAKLESIARKAYDYYLPFHRLANSLGLELEHVDLFFYRQTSQKQIESLVLTSNSALNDFGRRQVELAIRLLVLSEPKVILVSNALAARIFKNQFGLKALDDDGLYFVPLNGSKVPVFLSGMLSGQRPLDSHSYERLVWHMKRALGVVDRATQR
jgi:hypothetical protein